MIGEARASRSCRPIAGLSSPGAPRSEGRMRHRRPSLENLAAWAARAILPYYTVFSFIDLVQLISRYVLQNSQNSTRLFCSFRFVWCAKLLWETPYIFYIFFYYSLLFKNIFATWNLFHVQFEQVTHGSSTDRNIKDDVP